MPLQIRIPTAAGPLVRVRHRFSEAGAPPCYLAICTVDVFSCSIVGVGGGSDAALDLNITDPSIRFTQYVLGDEGQYAESPLEDGCITCALRQGIVNFVYSRMLSDESVVGGVSWHFGEESDNQRREKETIILLPQGVELSHLMPGLTEEMDNLSVRVMGAVHIDQCRHCARRSTLTHSAGRSRTASLCR